MLSDELFEFAKELYASQGYTITKIVHDIVKIDEDHYYCYECQRRVDNDNGKCKRRFNLKKENHENTHVEDIHDDAHNNAHDVSMIKLKYKNEFGIWEHNYCKECEVCIDEK